MQRKIFLFVTAFVLLATTALATEPATPRIVKMEPANWAIEVDPEKVDQLRVTFDRDMNTTSYSWCGGGATYPKTTAKPEWIDERTCVLPVALEPQMRYELSINAQRFMGFRSVDGIPVAPTPYTFYTTGSPEIDRSEQHDGATIIFFRDASRSPAVVDGSHKQRWKADLTWLQETLPAKHKDLFFKISREDFQNRMNVLITSVPDSDDRALMAELIKIVNSVGDSHTNVFQRGLFYPASFFLFEEGVFVNSIDARFAEYYGQKLTAVEGIPIEQVLEHLQPFIHRDNAFYEKHALANALWNSNTLYLAGIADSPSRIRYTFGDKDWTISHAELGGNNTGEWLPASEQRLLSQKNSNENWFERLDDGVLYIKYNACIPAYSTLVFLAAVSKEIDKEDVTKIILDLRDNGGGSSPLLNPFIAKMTRHPKLNTPENFKVIIGRKTFSSAMLNALDLKASTKATFIGEPTGSKANHYGEVRSLSLTNISVSMGYSTKYFKRSSDDEDALYPDVFVPLRAEDWFSGKDVFLEAALR